MDLPPIKIAYLTAGAGGMVCGSCLHDNTLARGLMRIGCDVQLIPTYTPIRTDEQDVSIDKIFYGGINVFLQQKIPPFRYLPPLFDRWLDGKRLLRWATFGRIETSAAQLGELTTSMLRGEAGYQRKEALRLANYLAGEKPQLINFSNVLIAGCAATIKARTDAKIVVTLQGDDLFLRGLPPKFQAQAIRSIAALAEQVDGFLTYSNDYADSMAEYLRLPRERFHIVPLGIDVHDFKAPGFKAPDFKAAEETSPAGRLPTIGFLARHCPEKGFHVLVDALIRIRNTPGGEEVRLHSAGWLGKQDRGFFASEMEKLKRAGLLDAFSYLGVVDRAEKIDFLYNIDVLSVPTTYREPKGLYVLEALAAGVPVVQPNHGAFPELLSATGGGRLFEPENVEHLAETLLKMLNDPSARRELGYAGQEAVHARHNADAMAQGTLEVYRRFLD